MNEQILDCGHAPSEHSDFTTGYGYDAQGKTYCYACIAKNERAEMDASGKNVMYLVSRDDGWHVTNWPASLDYKAYGIRKSWHNFAGSNGRTDFWFRDHQGKEWHGYQIGQWNQIAHVKRLKSS